MKTTKFSLVPLAIAAALAASPAVSIGQSQDFSVTFSSGTGITLVGSGTFEDLALYPGQETTQTGYLVTSFNGTYTNNGLPSYPGYESSTTPYTFSLVPYGGSCCAFQEGIFLVDNLVFPGNNVNNGTSNTGYFDDWGLIVNVGGPVGYVNLDTSAIGSIYPSQSGIPYVLIFSDTQYILANPPPSLDGRFANVTVPEGSALAMLALCVLVLAGASYFKSRQSGLSRDA
jgi:hypothetical protein